MRIDFGRAGNPYFSKFLLFILGLACPFGPISRVVDAEISDRASAAPRVGDDDAIKPMPNGIELRRGNVILQVVALRDDVLRVRIGTHGELPEDASWAVSQEVRRQAVSVIPESSADAYGFYTKILRVRVARDI